MAVLLSVLLPISTPKSAKTDSELAATADRQSAVEGRRREPLQYSPAASADCGSDLWSGCP